MNSIYYVNTMIALRKGEFLSTHQMLMDMQDTIWFDREHARDEILKAVNNYAL